MREPANKIESVRPLVITARWILPALLSVGFFVFHLRYAQRFIDHDEIVYIYNTYASYKEAVFNPHHLHMEMGGKIFHDWMRSTFSTEGFNDIMFNLRLRSLIAAAFGFFSCWILLHRVTGSGVWAFWGTLLFTSSHGFMSYVTRVDTAVFPAAWLPLMILCAHHFYEKPGFLFAVFTGLVFAVGIVLHQYMGLACATLFLPLLIPPAVFRSSMGDFIATRQHDRAKVSAVVGRSLSYPKRFTITATVVLWTTLFTSTAYLYAGRTVYHLPFDRPRPAEATGLWNYLIFQHWIITYLTVDDWGQGIRKFKSEEPLRGFIDAFSSQEKPVPKYNRNFRFDFALDRPADRNAAPYNWPVYYTLLVIAGTLLFGRILCARYGPIPLMLVLSLGIFTWLGAYWEPFYYEFWILPVEILIFLGTILSAWAARSLQMRLRIFSLPVHLLTAAFCLLILLHNVKYWMIPHSRIEYREGTGTWEDEPEHVDRVSGGGIYRRPSGLAELDPVFK